MDHGARYQLLDHGTDESPLWDVRRGITEHLSDGRRTDRHRERVPEELRRELERLLRDGHVELYEMSDPDQRVLRLDEALAVIAVERNWSSPDDPGESERRETIYALVLTDSGDDEFRQEYARANRG